MTNNYEAIALASSTEVLDDKNEFMFKVLMKQIDGLKVK